jgi:hypothetical protein
MDAEPIIFLRLAPDGFKVTIEPAQPGDDWDRTFTEYRSARPWARGCRLARRWRLIDETQGEAL